ncbi:hypothetical protein C8A05DRAFT_36794, partial [Staphylotrichum tortipilum]
MACPRRETSLAGLNTILLVMYHVKAGRVTKPSGAPGGAAQTPSSARRRGRPAIDWTRSRRRRLLRLYLCTPEAELSLKQILELLADGPFQPKPRHTQCLLNEMLSKSYRQKRPKNRTTMRERLDYLRSVRDGRLLQRHHHPRKQQQQQQPGGDPQTASASYRQVVSECAVLLRPNPTARAAAAARARNKANTEAEASLDSPCSAAPPPPPPPPDRKSPAAAVVEGEWETPLEGGEPAEGDDAGGHEFGPETFRNPWASSSSGDEARRLEKFGFLRERCPSRSSSFLADVASLISGLSIRSSLSRSSSGSSRRSWRSAASVVGAEPSASCSGPGPSGDAGWPVADRPSSAVSAAESLDMSFPASPVGVPFPTAPSPTSVAVAGQTPPAYYSQRNAIYMLENQELVRSCCSKTAWCIHQRIHAILTHGSPAEAFVATAAEVNRHDGLANTALHVAARWGAPGPVLFRIMTLASDLSAANHRGETFLHVLDPAALGPRELAHMVQFLVGKSFSFTWLDETSKTFLTRLMTRRALTLESLEAIFSHLAEADRLTLFNHPAPYQLVNSIRIRHLAETIPAAAVGTATETATATSPSGPIPDHAASAAATAYCAYFTTRYGTPHRPAWITPTLLCHIPCPPPAATTPAGSDAAAAPDNGPLHSLISALNVGRALHPPTAHNLCLNRPAALPFMQALSLALDAYPSDEDVNRRAAGTQRTPLAALLAGLAWGQHDEGEMARLVGMMLARGARVGACDAAGDNALHWAARLGLAGAVAMFCEGAEGKGLIRVMNRSGRTAREVASEEGWVVPRTEAGRRVGRHAEV